MKLKQNCWYCTQMHDVLSVHMCSSAHDPCYNTTTTTIPTSMMTTSQQHANASGGDILARHQNYEIDKFPSWMILFLVPMEAQCIEGGRLSGDNWMHPFWDADDVLLSCP